MSADQAFAVRSSSTAERFAQGFVCRSYDSFLNIRVLRLSWIIFSLGLRLSDRAVLTDRKQVEHSTALAVMYKYSILRSVRSALHRIYIRQPSNCHQCYLVWVKHLFQGCISRYLLCSGTADCQKSSVRRNLLLSRRSSRHCREAKYCF